MARMVEGVVTSINPASDLAMRCERKAVLLRTREGEVRKEFLMLGLGQSGTLTVEEQQRIIHGADDGALELERQGMVDGNMAREFHVGVTGTGLMS